MTDRRQARELAEQAVSDGEPLRWFEQLYSAAESADAAVPWADLEVNPHLAGWSGLEPDRMHRVLVVGCGYGDDAEWLSRQGCDVTAFDIAPSAVQRCIERFPETRVSYRVADLIHPPAEWLRDRFDLVVEIYTVQVLPPGSPARAAAIGSLATLTAGTLLVIARARGETDDPGVMPWPLLAAELQPLEDLGLRPVLADDFVDDEDPPVRRLRASYERQPAAVTG
jgi:SAM-dependent methyltransferase